ncbi:MAG TPA: FecR domain-containing protein [Rhizomicrobium sp.]|jgi:transmembrane sensor|nr:FecR domain-containing protein [Rhizomicrobium sp.]
MSEDMEYPTDIDARAAKAKAAEWRDREDREDWSEEDQAALDAWLAESPANMVAYLRVDAAWNRADRLSALRTPSRNALAVLGGRLASFMRAALGLVVLGGVGFAAWHYFVPPGGQVFATALGSHRIIKLADGSRIELNTDTVARVDVTATRRLVSLEKGEAYFEIVHDPMHPLVVLAGKQRITDLGTKFSVRANADQIRIALVEGRAQFDTTDGHVEPPVLLTPGDVLVKSASAIVVTRETARNLADELSWRHGMLVFLHTPLADVARELNRYNNEKIVIADASVGRLTINGSFPATNVLSLTDTARDVFGLRVEKRGDEVVISR